jgi:hypothetical protein
MDLGGARLLAREAVPLPAEHGSARRCPYTFFKVEINRTDLAETDLRRLLVFQQQIRFTLLHKDL